MDGGRKEAGEGWREVGKRQGEGWREGGRKEGRNSRFLS